MRRLSAVLLVFATVVASASAAEPGARAATPEEIALLQEALNNAKQDTEHWAYTETSTLRLGGDATGKTTVVRFDPSKPYEEQYEPFKVEGRDPTDKDRKKYRKQGEQRHRKLQGKATPKEEEGDFVISDGHSRLDPDHPQVLEAGAERIVFEIPLIATRRGIPVEKFQILAEVNPATRLLERARVRVRESFRVKLVAKLKKGEASVDFAVKDPQFGPVIAEMRGDFGGSFLLIPVKGTFTSTRTDWKRVKAFDERFSVTMEPLKLFGF